MVLEAYPTEGTAFKTDGTGRTTNAMLDNCAALFGAMAPPEFIEIAICVYDPGTTETTTRRRVEFTTEHGAEMLFKYAEHETNASWLVLTKLLPVTEIELLKYPTTGWMVDRTGASNTANTPAAAIVTLKGKNIMATPCKPEGVPALMVITILDILTIWQVLALVGPTLALHDMYANEDASGNLVPMTVIVLVA